MTNTECHDHPLHAKFYADRALQRTVEIVENLPLARDTYRVRFACPEIARRVLPGQFLMVRLAGYNDPLIGRPLALYDTVPDREDSPWALDVVYLAKGKFTSRLAQCGPGTKLDVWGPLGNGFPTQACDTLIMVAGGIGQTPFVALGQESLGRRRYGEPVRRPRLARQAILCYGARTADYLAGVEDFERIGVVTRLATDDGSRGFPGLVTRLLEQVLSETKVDRRIACCGPEPMMAGVSRIAAQNDIPCQVSLETPMACGVGICFTCVAKVRDATGGWDYKRTCVDGPVFDATALEW
jgi:dihydroorotate dehydrogenase electron transfer subunit